MNKVQTLIEEAQKIKKQFEACENYKQGKGITEGAKRSVDFYEGRQWLDNKTKLPFEKPTVNIVQNIADTKIASMNQKAYTVSFVVSDDRLSTDKVTRFAEYQMKELDQDGLNMSASKDAVIKGTAFWYLWWNEDKIGSMGTVEGSIEASMVDIADIGFSNPKEKDVQKQEYIIIRSRESVKFVRENCSTLKDKDIKKYINKDDYQSRYTKDVEQDDEEMCTCYLKFFRKDGEVYFEKSTNEIVWQEATPLNPNLNKEVPRVDEKNIEEEKSVYDNDPVNRSTFQFTRGDDYTDVEAYENKYKANQYPIVAFSVMERNDSIFGLSFVEQIIPIQKQVNQLLALNLLAASKNTMPTMVVKAGALGTSKIDLSKPNAVITDYSGSGVSDSIKLLNTGTINTTQFELAQSTISLAKDVYRANDILNDGRGISSGLSGTAIANLKTLQDTPIAQWQQSLKRAIEREGKILEMFYKLFYRDKIFTYQMDESEMQQIANQQGIDMNSMSSTTTDLFNGEEYLDKPFSVVVDAIESTQSSEMILSSFLETFIMNGNAQNLGIEWAELLMNVYPDSMLGSKAKASLKRGISNMKQSIITQLSQQNQQLQEQLQQLLQQSQATVQGYQQAMSENTAQYNERLRQLRVMANQNSSSENSRK